MHRGKQNPPRIYLYIDVLGGGGAERVMANLANAFVSDGYDTTIITSCRVDGEYSLDEKVKRFVLEESELKQSRIRRNVGRIAKLRRICKKGKPDILISFMAESNFRAILATKFLPVKTLVSVRNDPCKEYPGMEGAFVGKVLLPMADGCVFQTKDAQQWFPRRLQKKSKVIYNAVNEDFYHIERTPIRGEIVTCGRLAEQKNHELLIEAFSEVVKNHPEAVLKIYGEGALHERLLEKINENGLSQRVFLMGVTNDVGSVLKTADLFVLSSDYEGMPNALMEALAAGVPCVSTDCPCGGPKELFGEALEKNLVECGDSKQLAELISRRLSESSTGEEEKKRAALFLPEVVNAEWEEYVGSLIK